MHHVERGAGHAFGEPQDAAKAQVLRELIVDLGEMLEAHPVFADELRIHVHDDVVVFRVDDAEPALLRQHLERLPDVAEIDHAAAARRQDVGGEYLQRRIAGLDRLRELPGEFGRRLGMQHDVIGPVARAFSDEVLVARFDRLLRRDTVAPIGEIDERRRAAEQRRAPDLLRSGRDERRAVGLGPHMMQMHVRIDAARHDDMPCCVDHALGGFGRERAGSRDRGDGLAGDGDITARQRPAASPRRRPE